MTDQQTEHDINKYFPKLKQLNYYEAFVCKGQMTVNHADSIFAHPPKGKQKEPEEFNQHHDEGETDDGEEKETLEEDRLEEGEDEGMVDEGGVMTVMGKSDDPNDIDLLDD